MNRVKADFSPPTVASGFWPWTLTFLTSLHQNNIMSGVWTRAVLGHYPKIPRWIVSDILPSRLQGGKKSLLKCSEETKLWKSMAPRRESFCCLSAGGIWGWKHKSLLTANTHERLRFITVLLLHQTCKWGSGWARIPQTQYTCKNWIIWLVTLIENSP